MDQRHPITASTLAELREIVERARNMPEDSLVRVRTRFGFYADGPLLKQLVIVAPEPLPPSEVFDERDLFEEPPRRTE